MSKIIKIIIIISILAIVGILISYFSLTKKDNIEYTTVKAEKNNLIQTVSEIGSIKASNVIDLNFLNNGKIAKIFVTTGEIVKKDSILAELDFNDLSIKKKEAQANLDVANASFQKLLAGATNEDIIISEANVKQAKEAYTNSEYELEKIKNSISENIAQTQKTLDDLESKTKNTVTSLEQSIIIAQTNLNNTENIYQKKIENKENLILIAIENKLTIINTTLDNVNTILTNENAKDMLSIKQYSYLKDTKNNLNKTEKLLIIAKNSLETLKKTKNNTNINQAVDDTFIVLDETFATLTSCYNALEKSITSNNFSQTELDTLKTTVNSNLTSTSLAISDVQIAKQNLTDSILDYEINISNAKENLINKQAILDDAIIMAKNTLATFKTSGEQQITTAKTKIINNKEAWRVANAKLDKIKSPANINDIALEQSKIKQAQTILDSVKNKINNSKIKAPVHGTITKINYEQGEQSQSTKPVISMLSENNFEIELLISEADITKIKINDMADINLDAFGEDVKFSGKVYFIEPAETEIQNVIYYKVLVALETNLLTNKNMDKIKIKHGMTANATIITAKKNNILTIPSRAIIEKNNGEKIIKKLSNEVVKEIPIKIGLRGDGGMIEVLSGVNEGDMIITFIKENK